VLRAKTDSAVRREGGSGSFRVAAPGAQPDSCATRTFTDVGGEYELCIRLFISCESQATQNMFIFVRNKIRSTIYRGAIVQGMRAARAGNFFLQI